MRVKVFFSSLAEPQAALEWFRQAFDELARAGDSFDLIFLDPPFADAEAYARTLAAVADSKLLSADGLLVAQHDVRLPLPEQAGSLHRFRLQKIGDNALSMYRRIP